MVWARNILSISASALEFWYFSQSVGNWVSEANASIIIESRTPQYFLYILPNTIIYIDLIWAYTSLYSPDNALIVRTIYIDLLFILQNVTNYMCSVVNGFSPHTISLH